MTETNEVRTMTATITANKAVIASFSRKPNGGTANIVCVPTKGMMRGMSWEPLPGWQKQGTATGSLKAGKVEFVPKDASFGRHKMELDAIEVRDFQFVRVQVKKGKGVINTLQKSLELHCAIDFNDPIGAQKLEQYMLTVRDVSTMTIHYQPEAEQGELPEATDEQREATAPEND